ncbi:hypothetical protein F9B85_11885 [Heliorestis acidaminivorans]|uniref:IstB-like ATP-binding domain-containing protein n=1 Tax=Heliorestis acidaminivorans TaxID=553427 RepID=A0A6I0EUP5_9FIRM|nr:ATP-binding protein [Heliorestis acidaminivorans]KAB2951502.1 hypothetical protein F9B85_11885 [Heliorestis acidaminivorans]
MSRSQLKAWKEAILECSKELKLPTLHKNLDDHIQEANQRNISYEEFLACLLAKECEARQETARYNRIHKAEFRQKKYLEDLSLLDLPEDAQKKLKLLRTLQFIPEGRNVILAGNPGTGNYRKFLVMERFLVAPKYYA